MYAVLRMNSFDPERLASAQERLARFADVHEAQPGYAGTILVDLGAGRHFTINLWQSEQHAAAALNVLIPEVEKVLNPLMAQPSQFVGAGRVLISDII